MVSSGPLFQGCQDPCTNRRGLHAIARMFKVTNLSGIKRRMRQLTIIIDTGSVKSALISKCHWHTSLEDKDSTIRPRQQYRGQTGLPQPVRICLTIESG